jgi:hypothetical protein
MHQDEVWLSQLTRATVRFLWVFQTGMRHRQFSLVILRWLRQSWILELRWGALIHFPPPSSHQRDLRCDLPEGTVAMGSASPCLAVEITSGIEDDGARRQISLDTCKVMERSEDPATV